MTHDEETRARQLRRGRAIEDLLTEELGILPGADEGDRAYLDDLRTRLRDLKSGKR